MGNVDIPEKDKDLYSGYRLLNGDQTNATMRGILTDTSGSLVCVPIGAGFYSWERRQQP